MKGMRALTERERYVLKFGEDWAQPGEELSVSHFDPGTHEPVVHHRWYRQWWNDDATLETATTDENEHPYSERLTCPFCARWPHMHP